MLAERHGNAQLLCECRAPLETIPWCFAPFCPRCVFHSPALTRVCSDNEHRGHTDGAGTSLPALRARLDGTSACTDPTPTPRPRLVSFKQAYVNFPAVVKPACGPACVHRAAPSQIFPPLRGCYGNDGRDKE